MSTAINSPSQENHNPIMLFDGKSVSNPGIAAAAAVLLMKNGRRYTVSQFLSSATVLEAEYRGLILGLHKAKQLGVKKLEIKGDSEILLQQIDRPDLITEEKLQTLHQQVQKLLKNFEKTSWEWISEEQNRPAINAVNRCIGEALGRESKASGSATPVSPPVARFLQLAEKATEKDYRKLVLKNDDFAFMALEDLRSQVPESIRDTIALQWDGNDGTLADIYRWYLRGLPPLMALHKAKLDNPPPEPPGDKLPWEGELIVSSSLKSPVETSDAFVEIPQPAESASTTPKSYTEKNTLLEIPLEEELFLEGTDDPNKDTLPTEEKVKHVLEIMNNLSDGERTDLADELVRSPEWVNLILKAIATQLSSLKE